MMVIATPTARGRWGALSALTLLLLAAPAAEAKIVSFSATLRAGFGDGGNPPTTTSTFGANGMPACSKGSITHLDASVPAQGIVSVSSGPAPQSIMDVRPFFYGNAGPPGPSPTFSRPGVPGPNGAARFVQSTCVASPTSGRLTPSLNARTALSSFAWPADLTVTDQPVTTLGGGTTTRPVAGNQPQVHQLAAGAGPGSFFVNVASSVPQYLSGAAGPNAFGGGFRASQSAQLFLNLDLGPGISATGTLFTGPNLRGHGRSIPTQVVTNSGTFTTLPFSGMVPATLRVWQMPFTTGRVVARNGGGSFPTTRTTTGFDNRTSMGEFGSLLLVSPWTASVSASNLAWSGTSTLEFQFLPEAWGTGALALGVAGVLGLHRRARRRR